MIEIRLVSFNRISLKKQPDLHAAQGDTGESSATVTIETAWFTKLMEEFEPLNVAVEPMVNQYNSRRMLRV